MHKGTTVQVLTHSPSSQAPCTDTNEQQFMASIAYSASINQDEHCFSQRIKHKLILGCAVQMQTANTLIVSIP